MGTLRRTIIHGATVALNYDSIFSASTLGLPSGFSLISRRLIVLVRLSIKIICFMVITVALIWFYRVQLDFNLVYPRFGTCRKASSTLFMQSNISNANTENYFIWFSSQPSALEPSSHLVFISLFSTPV